MSKCECDICTMRREDPDKYRLHVAINDNGRWEEYHENSKHGNHYMFRHHKSRRLELQAEYDKKYGKVTS